MLVDFCSFDDEPCNSRNSFAQSRHFVAPTKHYYIPPPLAATSRRPVNEIETASRENVLAPDFNTSVECGDGGSPMKKSNRKRAIHSLVREAGSDGTVWHAHVEPTFRSESQRLNASSWAARVALSEGTPAGVLMLAPATDTKNMGLAVQQ
jgi:hypothetical protein